MTTKDLFRKAIEENLPDPYLGPDDADSAASACAELAEEILEWVGGKYIKGMGGWLELNSKNTYTTAQLIEQFKNGKG